MNRIVTIVIGLVVILAGGGAMMYLTSQAKPPKRNAGNNGAPTVLAKALTSEWVKNEIDISGKLIAENRVEIFSEVQGVLLSSGKLFKEGMQYNSGEVMLRLDSTEFYLNLMSNKSTYLNMLVQLWPDIKYDFPEEYKGWQKYVAGIDITKPLTPIPAVKNEKHKNFLTSRDVYKQYYSIKSQEEKLTKYNLKAPFSGAVSEGNVQPGTMIRVGQKLGSFIHSGAFELEVAVSMNNANLISIGDSVLLKSENMAKTWLGQVTRLSQNIDQTTQSVKVFVRVMSNDLREGMYLSGKILSGGFANSIKVPRELLIGVNEVYFIEDSNLVLKEVNVLKIGDSEVVVDGLKETEVIMNQVFSSAFNGMKVSPIFEK